MESLRSEGWMLDSSLTFGHSSISFERSQVDPWPLVPIPLFFSFPSLSTPQIGRIDSNVASAYSNTKLRLLQLNSLPSLALSFALETFIF